MLKRLSRYLPAILVLFATQGSLAELLYITEKNNLRRLDIQSITSGNIKSEIFVQSAERKEINGKRKSIHDDPARRDMNGMICQLPDGSGFINGEDTGQPSPPAGWGIFDNKGVQKGKLTATYYVDGEEPYGCAFNPQGQLFTVAVGNQGFGTPKGHLIQWFPPFNNYPGKQSSYPNNEVSDNFCKLATDIGNALGIAIDNQGRIYVASAGQGAIYRFAPPFPTAANTEGGCGNRDIKGSPIADNVKKETFFSGLYTFSGLVFAPNGNLYAGSVFTGEIIEINPDGELVRKILDPDGFFPPFETGSPMGLAIDSKGNLYYADLALYWKEGWFNIGTGKNGKVRQITFDDKGNPNPPKILLEGLGFPDGVAVFPGQLP